MAESRLCRGCAADSVELGAADTATTPPVPATASRTASGFIRGVPQTARAPAWLTTTGARLTRQASSAVRSPTCATSTVMPRSFMRLTACSPSLVRPSSGLLARPPPSGLPLL